MHSNHTLLISISILFFLSHSSFSSPLSPLFYSLSCPNTEFLVRASIRSAAGDDPSLPGKLLRLLFHDCIVQGCDASVLVAGNGTERSDPANRSLGGFEVLESTKRLLDLFCPGVVSCADVLVLAARDAVALAGGPSVEVPLGRRDSRVSLESNVRPNMVDTSFSLDEMSKLFSSKGLTMDDLVALSENYAMELIQKCPANANPSVTVNDDPVTPTLFDNQYYINLLNRTGLFLSDSILLRDPRTREKIESFAKNQDEFFASWAESFVKLTSIGVKTGGEGGIRSSCSSLNG
ncbi:Peroxidase 18 [Platanthera zijinensis]|uniref:Peroxidase n=1 Tax=Platanthera zijinensis TaxID=2320716 RepID=A0AAP0B3F7_9ASPA